MKTTTEIGRIGEDIAEKYLKKHGYKILSRNYGCRGGEIDIVCFRFGVLVFVEVKARSNDSFGLPSDAVGIEKIRRIRTAARDFSINHVRSGKISVFYPFGIELKRSIYKKRIDVIEVFLSEGNRINHIKDWEKRL